MKLVSIWITAIISMLVVSVYYLALKPANDLLMENVNSTMLTHATGPQATSTFNLIMEVWGIAFRVWVVVSLLALAYWAWAKMQEREVLTGVYG